MTVPAAKGLTISAYSITRLQSLIVRVLKTMTSVFQSMPQEMEKIANALKLLLRVALFRQSAPSTTQIACARPPWRFC